jgi:Na+/proline symporter
MPAGLSGLVIAAVFAAAMSSLDSSMHSIATAISTDFVKRRRPHISDADLLRFARWATFGLGVAGTLTAAYLATLKTRFLWEFFLEMVGLFGGTLCGIFMLGVFSPRVRAGHVWWGALASLLVLLTVRFGTDVSGLAYATIGAVVCYVMARLAALVA